MKIKNMLYAAMFAAIVAVLGLMPPIPLPFIPVPITLQTMGVMLAGSFLGKRENANQVKGRALLTLMVLRHIIGMITNTDLLKSWMEKAPSYIITMN